MAKALPKGLQHPSNTVVSMLYVTLTDSNNPFDWHCLTPALKVNIKQGMGSLTYAVLDEILLVLEAVVDVWVFPWSPTTQW